MRVKIKQNTILIKIQKKEAKPQLTTILYRILTSKSSVVVVFVF